MLCKRNGRVLYLTEAKKDSLYYNIPIANTTVILLGTGTSITQAAVRMLAQAGVCSSVFAAEAVRPFSWVTILNG